MPSPWQPILVPLVAGVDTEQDALAGHAPTLVSAVNVDFGRRGVLRARVPYKRDGSVGLRGLTTGAAPYDAGTNALSVWSAEVPTGWGGAPRALIRLRDGTGERPALVAPGRIWSYDAGRWTDRLGCWAASERRRVAIPGITNFNILPAVADTFCSGTTSANKAVLFTEDGSVAGYQFAQRVIGWAAVQRSGDVHAVIGAEDGTNNLRMQSRTGMTFTFGNNTILAADCATIASSSGIDAPKICCDHDATVFFVIYKTTTAGQYKVLRVTTGASVSTTATFSPGGTITSVAIANTPSADNRVVIAYTVTGSNRPFSKVLNATTLADIALDVNLETGIGGEDATAVVLGAAYNGVVWHAFRTATTESVSVGNRSITAATSTGLKILRGTTGSATTPAIRWGITHQPVFTGTTASGGRRVVLGVAGGGQFGNASTPNCTRYEWDISDLYDGGANRDGATLGGVLAARGELSESDFPRAPRAAIVAADGMSWTFAAVDWTFFDALGGTQREYFVVEVRVIRPVADVAGESTIISGSVPHAVSRGFCHEVGFPCLGGFPPLQVQATAGGAVPAGSYTVRAVWVWTDEAGQVHRSGVSLPVTITTTGGGNQTISISVGNCQLTERETDVKLEIYCTDVDPTDDDLSYLQVTLSPTAASAVTTTTITTAPVTTTEVLYTDGGVIENQPPRADGGVVTLGRRIWASDGRRVRASKLVGGPAGRDAPIWGADPVLEVLPAAPAGRVEAMTAMDDRVWLLCERGIYAVVGEGPDDTGGGPEFFHPIRLGDIGVAGPRSWALTPEGPVVQARFTYGATTAEADGALGGLYLVDRSGALTRISRPVSEHTQALSAAADLAYNPERSTIHAVVPAAATQDSIVAGDQLVYDTSCGCWATWQTSVDRNAETAIVVEGTLWVCGAELGRFYDTGEIGRDHDGTTPTNFTMSVRTSHLAADGSYVLGWSRVRAVRLLGRLLGDHTLTLGAVLDVTGDGGTTTFSPDDADVIATWPTSRYAPEHRTTQQKCSQVQVFATASPARAEWTHAALVVRPLPRGHAPPRYAAGGGGAPAWGT